MLKYRHPQLGRFQRLKIGRGTGLGTVAVSEMELRALTRYLNNAQTPEQKRVLWLLEEMQKLDEMEVPIFTEKIDGPSMVTIEGVAQPNPAFEKVAPEKYQRQLEIDQRQAALNKELERYQFTPYALRGSDRWVVIWWRHRETQETPEEMTEGQAVELILNFVRAGYLNRLKRCGHCQNWLYAKFRHQSFCSMKCQQKVYTKSQEWKEHRNKYMRDYYQLMKTRRNKLNRGR